MEAPFARHGPILEADPDSIHMQRLFWGHCAMGFILDYRKFLVSHLQHLINSIERIRGAVIVVGRDSFFYMIHFEHMEDLEHMCFEGPWSMDGAFLFLEKWRPNLVMNRLHLNFGVYLGSNPRVTLGISIPRVSRKDGPYNWCF